ncbi:MAG: hypothetical protein JO116_25355 [Planctomycetaceae bacterium]|nr:hypothetical protein [Planctomycetaceae bacterium]
MMSLLEEFTQATIINTTKEPLKVPGLCNVHAGNFSWAQAQAVGPFSAGISTGGPV